MFETFELMVRQCILYSLPMLITLTMVPIFEHKVLKKKDVAQSAFFAKETWLPFLVSILFGRAIIFVLPCAKGQGLKGAWVRFLGHGLLCILGFFLYQWALAHPPLTGLPPLHHWWAKVLMYLNLCLMALHVLPMPNMVVGECMVRYFPLSFWVNFNRRKYATISVWVFLAASPALDLLLGGRVIFPVYEQLASFAE